MFSKFMENFCQVNMKFEFPFLLSITLVNLEMVKMVEIAAEYKGGSWGGGGVVVCGKHTVKRDRI